MSPPASQKQRFPKYVHEANGRIVYRPRIGEQHRHLVAVDKSGFLKPPVRLGKAGDSYDQILRAYIAAKDDIDARLDGKHKRNTLFWLSKEYQGSSRYRELSTKSQKNNEVMVRILEHKISIDGKQGQLGDLPVSRLTKPMIRILLDKRLAKYQQAGKKGTAMVNREKAYLSAMVAWGIEHIEGLGLPANPFHDLKKFKEVARDRYVTDEEFEKQSEVAREVAAYLPIVFEITYLCAARGIEAVDLTRQNIQTDGVLINRRKGSDDNIIVFSPRLRTAIDAALAMHKQGTVRTMKLLVNTRGEALTKGALDTAMQRVKELMEQRNQGDVYWSLHLLKHKGITDSENKRIGGHATEAMQRRYDHSMDRIEPPR